ncbi:transporter substrate-binding domain-containing protein [Shewanella sp. C32]|uniref:Transporter substrate-binding domain-containing protein n=1 Tax=Shewanella electrica TaxID=515560 RepID=A0ABT2FIT4_9GAMM|nr:HD domain-containing phosphohydrolase [Shewanella electrica]MCH1924336.1 transporter substrate-binding domain-containing protein [Shewanella electrica]MCS4556237.1 transporter substrate-binding domain-containing protein [Shewanella electrica]
MLNIAKSLGRLNFSIRVTVVSVFIIATLITALVALTLQYHFAFSLAKDNVEDNFRDFGEEVGQALKQLDDSAASTVRILAKQQTYSSIDTIPENTLDLFAEFMRTNAMFNAIYVGFSGGDIYEVVNLDSAAIMRRQYEADANDRWLIIQVRDIDGKRVRQMAFLSENYEVRHTREEPSNYYADRRLWFRQSNALTVNKTEPYLFQNLQAPGQTYSLKVNNGHAVIALDIALSSVLQYFATNMKNSHAEAYIYQPSGSLIAAVNQKITENDLPQMPKLNWTAEQQQILAKYPEIKVSNETNWSPIDFMISGEPSGYSVDFLRMVAQAMGVHFNFVNGVSWSELLQLYQQDDIDMLQSVNKSIGNSHLGEFSDAYLDLPFALVTSDQQPDLYNIASLYGKTIAIPQGWTIVKYIQRKFPQIRVVELPTTKDVLQAVASGKVFGGIDSHAVLKYEAANYFISGLRYQTQLDLNSLGVPSELHLVVKTADAELLPLLNQAMKEVNARHSQLLSKHWLGEQWQQEHSTTVPYQKFIEFATDATKQNQLIQTAEQGKDFFVYVTRVDEAESYTHYLAVLLPRNDLLEPAIKRVAISLAITIGVLILLSPASWLFSGPIVSPIRRLAIENEKIRNRQYDKLDIPNSSITEVHNLGQSIKEMASAIQTHEQSQQELLDAFIQLIAQAIDYKSPYTAGHCLRVPELALMLAKQAHDSDTPAFADFKFNTNSEWREFRVGAWLHDCGKITTPEHIVDKGSKLEVIYNRIHEVRMRFEVLLRDADIEYWRALNKTPEKQALLAQQREVKRAQIMDDFAFVAKTNVGGEQLSDADKARLVNISKQSWTRHLSDRLGLSPLEERMYHSLEPEESLPATEQVLSDKPIHEVPRFHSTDYPEHLGIKMDIPKLLYHRGELHNLMIERGTLTAEDRFKINEHIVNTIQMLDTLPFPPELSKVPRYASTHHETLDGRGYPRKLTADDLSVPERIMVLADIFEALTANDRPYKKAKPVSVSLKILAQMVKDGHVDEDVFKLFLSSGIYLDYARRYLAPEQIDAVDIEQFMDVKWRKD